MFADPVFHDTAFRSSTGTLRSIAHNAFGAAPHSPEVVVYTMPSTQISAEGFVSGGRNGTGGSVSAPLLTYRVWMKPSLPTTNSGSTRPKPIGAGSRPRPGSAGAPRPPPPPPPACPVPVEGAPRWRGSSVNTQAP